MCAGPQGRDCGTRFCARSFGWGRSDSAAPKSPVFGTLWSVPKMRPILLREMRPSHCRVAGRFKIVVKKLLTDRKCVVKYTHSVAYSIWYAEIDYCEKGIPVALTIITAIEKNVAYSEQAYTELKRLIILNDLKAGTVLNERNVSERLGISRTPVRDALQMLESKGWVTRRGKNKVVTTITQKIIQEIFDIRRSLELLSVDLARDKIVDTDLGYYNSLIEQFVEIRDRATLGPGLDPAHHIAILEIDKQFHLYMSKISGNDTLRTMLDELFEQFVRIHIVTFQGSPSRMDQLVHNHAEMNAYLQDRDFDGYKEAVIKHITMWPN
jgi:DNA-binding GntR family transcriptional regulator